MWVSLSANLIFVIGCGVCIAHQKSGCLKGKSEFRGERWVNNLWYCEFHSFVCVGGGFWCNLGKFWECRWTVYDNMDLFVSGRFWLAYYFDILLRKCSFKMYCIVSFYIFVFTHVTVLSLWKSCLTVCIPMRFVMQWFWEFHFSGVVW